MRDSFNSDDRWEEPIEIYKESLPEFPIQIFPDWIKNYVVAISEELQVPMDMPSNLIFTVLSTALVKKFSFYYSGTDWSLDLNNFMIISAPPGTKKSAIHKKILNPVFNFEKEILEKKVKERSSIKSKHLMKQKRLENVSTLYAKNKDADLEKEIEQLTEDIDKLNNQLIIPKYIAGGDVTQEKLVEILLENGEKLTLSTDEGSELFSYFNGKYQNTRNIDIYLKAWDGSYYSKYRKGGEDIRLEEPLLTIGLLTQPEELKTLKNLEGRGLTERFLYATLEKSSANEMGEAISLEIKNEYEREIEKLIAVKNTKKQVIKLEKEVILYFKQLYKKIYKEVLNENHSNFLRQWYSKLFGSLIKLVTLLHVSNELYDNTTVTNAFLSKVDIEKIELLLEYYEAHAKQAFGIIRDNKNISDLEYLENRIIDLQKNGRVNLTFLGDRTKRFTSGERRDLLKYLEDYNRIRIERVGRKTNIYVNPFLLNKKSLKKDTTFFK